MSALTPEALFQHLWKAADILRGPMDASIHKRYLLGLLLLKRLSDRFEEEVEELIAKGSRHQVAWTDRDEHQYMVPESARWSTIQNAGHLGDKLNRACAHLAHSNPMLDALLELDFNDHRSFRRDRPRDYVLNELLNHFSSLSLRNSHLRDPATIGLGCEIFLEHCARDEGKHGGEFSTPRQVTELVVQLLAPRRGMRICDPACGTGGMLVRCATYVAQRHGQRLGADPIDLTLHGQEINREMWTLCKMNMLLSGLPDAYIASGDTLREPRLLGPHGLMLYDRVLAHPPFSLSGWRSEWAETDPFARFHYGLPPRHMGDYAFVQHVLATLNSTGMAGLVVSHGALFRGGVEGSIRKGMIDDDVIEAIIGLPANLFHGTGIPSVILVLNRAKPSARKDKILFVDASTCYETRGRQNELRPVDVERIVAAFRKYEDEERFCRVVTVAEISANEDNLTIPRYVNTRTPAAPVNIDGELAALRELEATRDTAAARMDELLRDLGHDP